MMSGEQGIDDPVEAGSKDGEWRCRLWGEMPRLGTSPLEFPPQIHQRHLDIEHGHLGRSLAE